MASGTEPMSRDQRLVLAVAVLASFVSFLDGTVVNVALPAIMRELGGSSRQSNGWSTLSFAGIRNHLVKAGQDAE